MDCRKIIMNFSVPPSLEDMEIISAEIFETLPEELLEFTDNLDIEIEDFPDSATEIELGIEDPYELLAIYRNGKEISPGVEKMVPAGHDKLILYRRSILDLWCESEDDLSMVIRQVMIEELGKTYNFSDKEIEEMIDRHFQGMMILDAG